MPRCSPSGGLYARLWRRQSGGFDLRGSDTELDALSAAD